MSRLSRRQNRQRTFGHRAWLWAPDNHNAAVQRMKARRRVARERVARRMR